MIVDEADRVAEIDCPRCHETCGWCGDYRFMHGKLRLSGGKVCCTIANMHPDVECPLCRGSRRVVASTTFVPAPAHLQDQTS